MLILRGYTTRETAYEVKDYPYGYKLRTSIFYWIESKAGNGDRFCSYTINPKNGRANASKCSTYSTFMYLYENEDGHVKNGVIDAYNLEQFEARFEFLVSKIGVIFLSEVQEQNLRINYGSHIRAAAMYELVKYSEENKPVFKAWLQKTLQHILTCSFYDLTKIPQKPPYDKPNEEVKMITRTIEEKKIELVQHSITIEKVTTLLQKVLPGFYVNVSEWKGSFGDTYLKIGMAVKNYNINQVAGQKVQYVSLGLNLDTLKLQPQMYGGNGGQCIYRKPNREDAREKYLAMARIKIPFRTPACNEKDVLTAIERFAVRYKEALIANKEQLMYQDLGDYDNLLK